MGDDLADEVRDVQFPVTRMRRGYDMGDVDAFLEQVLAAVRTEQPVRPLVDAAAFRVVRSSGYDMPAVDLFLDRVVIEQEASGDVAAPAAAPLVPAPPVEVGEPLPSAIQEQKGLFGRLFGR